MASSFNDWNDFISSDRKELLRVSNLLNAKQVKKLAHCIELFNHGLFTSEAAGEEFRGQKPNREGLEWTTEEDKTLIKLAVHKYDFKFGDPWLYVSFDMERTSDEVQDRFVEIYLKPLNRNRQTEISLTKSFRPLLMNRHFRLLPPQCYIIPSEENFPLTSEKFTVPDGFKKYRSSLC